MSNQTKPAPPKIVVAPEGCQSWLTAGKEYDVTQIWSDWIEYGGYGFSIINDIGNRSDTVEFGSEHLNGGNWIIKEREVSHD